MTLIEKIITTIFLILTSIVIINLSLAAYYLITYVF